MLGMTNQIDLDGEWEELLHTALAGDGRISDRDVRLAIELHRPKIEALVQHDHSRVYCDTCWEMFSDGRNEGLDTNY